MATDPNRLTTMMNTGIVPVARQIQPGTGYPEAAKLAMERINSMPPASFDAQVRTLNQAPAPTGDAARRLAVANTVGTPGAVPTSGVNPPAALNSATYRMQERLAGFPGMNGLQNAMAKMQAHQAAAQARRDTNMAEREDRRNTRLKRVQDIMAAHPNRANVNPNRGLLGR